MKHRYETLLFCVLLLSGFAWVANKGKHAGWEFWMFVTMAIVLLRLLFGDRK